MPSDAYHTGFLKMLSILTAFVTKPGARLIICLLLCGFLYLLVALGVNAAAYPAHACLSVALLHLRPTPKGALDKFLALLERRL